MVFHWKAWVPLLWVPSSRHKFVLITKELQDWDQLIAKVVESNVLHRLLKLSVTIPDQPDQMQRVLRLSGASDMREFTLFRVTAARWSLTSDFASSLVQQHGSRLTKLAVMRILVPTSVLTLLCYGCPNISSLFFVGEQGKLVSLESGKMGLCAAISSCPYIKDEISEPISHLRRLSVLHLNFSYAIDEEGEEDDVDFFNDKASLLEVVEKCSPELRQFGVNTRVWTVRPSGDHRIMILTVPRVAGQQGFSQRIERRLDTHN